MIVEVEITANPYFFNIPLSYNYIASYFTFVFFSLSFFLWDYNGNEIFCLISAIALAFFVSSTVTLLKTYVLTYLTYFLNVLT